MLIYRLLAARGQSLIEYTLILLLVTFVVFVLLVLLGPQLASEYHHIENNL